MAGADYDGIAGVLRVLDAGEKPETFAIEVITLHAAVEYELDLVLAKLVPRPDHLFHGSPRFTFAHKVKLLNALWRGSDDSAAKLIKVLVAFQNLRDAVAHTDRPAIKSCNTNLTIAFRDIAHEASDEYSILEVARGICLFLSDGMTEKDVITVFDQLDRLVNEELPRAFGVAP